LLIGVFALLLAGAVTAQDGFDRKGRVLIETGYNLVAGFSTGTGGSVILNEGEAITSLAFDGGYFVTRDLAIKGHVSLLATDGNSLVNLGAGAKYYVIGVIPVELTGGILTGSGNSQFLGDFNVGYAIPLAPNIALEPNLGLILQEGSLFQIGARFAMFL
ncbi:MAG: hypothetical protein AAFV80_22945, partial [Bacteroidota bacterium]